MSKTHQVLQSIEKLQHIFPKEDFPVLSDRLHQYTKLFQTHVPTIAFIGEWSRGKSSLINCLLGNALLPVDVRPTTASVVCIQETSLDTEHAVIHKQNSVHHNSQITAQTLQAMQTAETSGVSKSEEISRIDLFLQNPLLQHCRLVDTPGVNDLRETPEKLIYQLLPHVDLVVFFFDCTNGGFSATEKEFIQTKVRSHYCSHFIVVGSHLDRVEFEDEEEQEEFEEEVREQIQTIFNASVPIFFGITKQQTAQNAQFISQIATYIIEKSEQAAKERIKNIKQDIQKTIQISIQEKQDIAQKNTQLTEQQLTYFDQLQSNLGQGFALFSQHVVNAGQQPIQQLLTGSLTQFENKCISHLHRHVAMSGKISVYAEHGLIQDLENMIQQWADVHIQEIKTYLMRHLQFVTQEYHNNFGNQIPFFPPKIQIHLPKNSNVVPAIDVEAIKAQERESENIRYILPGILSVVGGMIALPMGVAGLYAGMKMATNAQRQTDTMIREHLRQAIPTLVQAKIQEMNQTISQLLHNYFVSLEHQIHQCLKNNLQHAQKQRDTLKRQKDSLLIQQQNQEQLLIQKWRQTQQLLR